MTIKSVHEMEEFARDIADDLKSGDILLLSGELGSGKTTFTKGLAKSLGVRDDVTSPTFNIVAEYKARGRDIKRLIHVDLYRLSNIEIEGETAIKEVLEERGDAVVVIEWADKLGEVMLDSVKRIEFKHGEGESERVVEVT